MTSTVIYKAGLGHIQLGLFLESSRVFLLNIENIEVNFKNFLK